MDPKGNFKHNDFKRFSHLADSLFQNLTQLDIVVRQKLIYIDVITAIYISKGIEFIFIINK